MAEFSDELKLEIVTRLAQFEAPGDILRDLGTRGIQSDYTQVGSYDPTRPYYEAGEKWREIFDAVRKAYLTDVAAVPVANQGYRLNILQKGLEAAVRSHKWDLAASLAEQASKEVGGVFTNIRELGLNDSRRPKAADLSPEDRKAVLADLIRSMMETLPPAPGQEPQHPTAQ
jgi:hypothetical protein